MSIVILIMHGRVRSTADIGGRVYGLVAVVHNARSQFLAAKKGKRLVSTAGGAGGRGRVWRARTPSSKNGALH